MTAARGAVAPAYRSSRSARIVDYAVILRLAYRTAESGAPAPGSVVTFRDMRTVTGRLRRADPEGCRKNRPAGLLGNRRLW